MSKPFRGAHNILINGLVDRPDHAAKLGVIVSLSAGLESQLGYLLALLSGGNAGITIAMLQAVTSTVAQRAMLAAAAKLRLSADDHQEFQILMKELASRAKERNDVTHNLWGTSPGYPDDAILCPAGSMAKRHAAAMGSYDPDEGLRLMVEAMNREGFKVYSLQDLQGIADRLAEQVAKMATFSGKLAARHPVLGVPAIFERENQPPQST